MNFTQWLASGGSFWSLAAMWAAALVFVFVSAVGIGRRFRVPHDGCLLALSGCLLALVGGGTGLLIAPFPYFLVTSGLLAFAFPGFLLTFFLWRLSKGR